ncbi:glycine zipper family protein [Methylomonas sp. AM2-LC]|uniref:glycine zipper family protein n=1 Tax=Methylomonas sp. AM2-LC TaxID=3153301 RepID=UPI0032678B81
MSQLNRVFALSITLGVSGCASIPTGPSVMVLPGTGQSFEQFRTDDFNCQQFALYQVGGTTPNNASISSGVTSAAVGTVIGAAAGAAIGGGAGGAAIGAGTGLLGGSLMGAGAASNSGYASQQHYDAAYIQCMYAKGHQVPVSGQFSNAVPARQAVPSVSAPQTFTPSYPPPPDTPPPPPPQ